ncbi:MAG TPA: hypothetical protein VF590_22475 [Isosphaeraceae bacterium]|jgi:hypothetical protein
MRRLLGWGIPQALGYELWTCERTGVNGLDGRASVAGPSRRQV